MPAGPCFIPGKRREAQRFPPAGVDIKEEILSNKINLINKFNRMVIPAGRFPRHGEAVGFRGSRGDASTAPAVLFPISLPPAIPQRVARQQSPPPLHRLEAILKTRGELCQERVKLPKNPLDTPSTFQRCASPPAFLIGVCLCEWRE